MPSVSPALALVASLLLAGCCAQSSTHAMQSSRSTTLADAHQGNGAGAERPLMVGRRTLPNGRAIAALGPRECERLLRDAAVHFDTLPHRDAPAISDPLELKGKLSSVAFEPANGMAKNGIVDCKLAVALLAWAPILHDAGVVKVEHFSTFRPGAHVRTTGKVSGHAHALAIDAAKFYLRDGRVIDVLEDWDERERGGAPCPVRRSEDADGRVLRQVVCRAVERDLFQVVITPHHDRDHQNHVHLEVVPKADWSFVH